MRTNTFSNAVKNQKNPQGKTTTTNGAVAFKSSSDACVDLFYNIGSSRGKDIVPAFRAAYAQDKNVALRIAAWVRDVRGGAGERQVFRDILSYLERTDKDAAIALLNKVPELGRWDDLFVVKTPELKREAFTLLGTALREKNGLAAKWTPRKGETAAEIRKFFGMSPKFYRKSLVELTSVVEQQMCAKDWDEINFSHVPSVAASRYKKAFYRNAEGKYKEYVAKLVKGDDPKVKVNASAIFPYDVLKGRIRSYARSMNATELALIEKQWEALPNYVGDAPVLPLVDVSGSMGSAVAGTNMSCLEVAVSLGLYLADKNKGKFKDTFLTFSSSPELMHLTGTINQKIDKMVRSNWQMSTDLNKAMDKILDVAIKGNVSAAEMPSMLLILSDMQFNACVNRNDTAFEMTARKFANAGYEMPKVVFWNLNAVYGNAPVKFDTNGTALVSGFSPSIVKPLLAGDMDGFTPEGIMLKTVMQDRYFVM